MPIIYGAPFVLLSAIAFGVFLVIPKMRPYKLDALIAPVAFGFWAIVVFGVVMLGNGLLASVLRVPLFPGPLQGLKGAVVLIIFYVVPGILGCWFSLRVFRRIVRR